MNINITTIQFVLDLYIKSQISCLTCIYKTLRNFSTCICNFNRRVWNKYVYCIEVKDILFFKKVWWHFASKIYYWCFKRVKTQNITSETLVLVSGHLIAISEKENSFQNVKIMWKSLILLMRSYKICILYSIQVCLFFEGVGCTIFILAYFTDGKFQF